MGIIIIIFTVIHFIAGGYYSKQARSKKISLRAQRFAECCAQHHEKCVMLGVIAGAMFYR